MIKNVLKSHHKKCNSLLSFVHGYKLSGNIVLNGEELVKEVFSKINDIHNSEDYDWTIRCILKYKVTYKVVSLV